MDENTQHIGIGKWEMKKFGYIVGLCQCLQIERQFLMTAALGKICLTNIQRYRIFGYFKFVFFFCSQWNTRGMCVISFSSPGHFQSTFFNS